MLASEGQVHILGMILKLRMGVVSFILLCFCFHSVLEFQFGFQGFHFVGVGSVHLLVHTIEMECRRRWVFLFLFFFPPPSFLVLFPPRLSSWSQRVGGVGANA